MFVFATGPRIEQKSRLSIFGTPSTTPSVVFSPRLLVYGIFLNIEYVVTRSFLDILTRLSVSKIFGYTLSGPIAGLSKMFNEAFAPADIAFCLNSMLVGI